MKGVKWRKPRPAVGRKTKVSLVGGPWHGHALYLADPASGTLPFWGGRYGGLAVEVGKTAALTRSTLTWQT